MGALLIFELFLKGR